ncbi:MAG: flavin-containing monooxygenase, partial [Gammaproteobacteria bacterium]
MPPAPSAGHVYDAIIIGAGMSGMYQLHRLRELGLSARIYEAGSGVGGTWYWNRYPGARFDSESYTYAFSFSPEILAEWNWREHFAAQPETLRYLEFVADRLDLRRDIQFNARVTQARYDEAANQWEITTAGGDTARGRYLITAIGVLSAPYTPDIPGRESFRGGCWHTAHWPKEPVALAGRRIGVIGTGATGVQLITELAKTAGRLTVFQRTPTFAVPMRNQPITDAEQGALKAQYAAMFERCRETFGGFVHDFDPRSALSLSPEEREAHYEALWQTPRFRFWLANFADIMSDRAANDTITDFVRRKIRARIRDPQIADRLIPTDHGFGTRRVPLESGYFEVYNQPNVELVDLRENPLERITPDGVRTRDAEYPLDILVFATGFDAVTGAFKHIDIRGRDGRSLQEKWAEGPLTYLGLQCHGFPNLFTIIGPNNAGNFCNVPRCIEQNVDWVTDCLRYLRDHHHRTIEPTPDAEHGWRAHVEEVGRQSLVYHTDSWITGANIPGKKRTFLPYAGGLPAYRARCDEVA